MFKKLGDAGLLGVTKPIEYGGMGLDYSYSVALAEELGSIECGGIPMAIGVQTDMSTPALAQFGSDLVKEQFLKPTIAGDFVACLGVSEVGAGSDVSGLTTTAVKDGDDYVINGGKMWTTNGTQADWMCALVNAENAPSAHHKTMICIPMDTPGVVVARKLDKLGMRSSDTAQIFLEDVRVPQTYRIGDEGKGFKYQMLQFQEERLWAGANALAPLQRIIDATIEYTSQVSTFHRIEAFVPLLRACSPTDPTHPPSLSLSLQRVVFDKAVLDNQVVQFRLAELQTDVECLRALLYNATEQYVAGEDVTLLTSMVKLKTGRLAREVADSCLQYWGGMGFMTETVVSRAYRDMRLGSIGGGADEVMLQVISQMCILSKRGA
mgnify:CR=1 FL=1